MPNVSYVVPAFGTLNTHSGQCIQFLLFFAYDGYKLLRMMLNNLRRNLKLNFLAGFQLLLYPHFGQTRNKEASLLLLAFFGSRREPHLGRRIPITLFTPMSVFRAPRALFNALKQTLKYYLRLIST